MSLVFSYLSRVLFSGFLQFKVDFNDAQNNSKYHYVAFLNVKISPFMITSLDKPEGTMLIASADDNTVTQGGHCNIHMSHHG